MLHLQVGSQEGLHLRFLLCKPLQKQGQGGRDEVQAGPHEPLNIWIVLCQLLEEARASMRSVAHPAIKTGQGLRSVPQFFG